jgi:hypothetical protein
MIYSYSGVLCLCLPLFPGTRRRELPLLHSYSNTSLIGKRERKKEPTEPVHVHTYQLDGPDGRGQNAVIVEDH